MEEDIGPVDVGPQAMLRLGHALLASKEGDHIDVGIGIGENNEHLVVCIVRDMKVGMFADDAKKFANMLQETLDHFAEKSDPYVTGLKLNLPPIIMAIFAAADDLPTLQSFVKH